VPAARCTGARRALIPEQQPEPSGDRIIIRRHDAPSPQVMFLVAVPNDPTGLPLIRAPCACAGRRVLDDDEAVSPPASPGPRTATVLHLAG
jgi:hypothetical protein